MLFRTCLPFKYRLHKGLQKLSCIKRAEYRDGWKAFKDGTLRVFGLGFRQGALL